MHRKSRRSFLTAVGSAGLLSVAGCSETEESPDRQRKTDNTGTRNPDAESLADVSAALLFPTFVDEGGRPIGPDSEYYYNEDETDDYDDPKGVLIPRRTNTNWDNHYRAILPYQLSLQATEDVPTFDTARVEIVPDVPVDQEYAYAADSEQELHERNTWQFSSAELTDGVVRRNALEFDFEKVVSDDRTALPLIVEYEIEFRDTGGEAVVQYADRLIAGTPNEAAGQEAAELIDITDTVWDGGRSLAPGAGTSVAYKSAKLWTAKNSQTIDEKLTRKALVKDIGGFKRPLEDDEALNEKLPYNDRTGAVGEFGLFLFDAFQQGDQTPLGTSTSSSPTATAAEPTSSGTRPSPRLEYFGHPDGRVTISILEMNTESADFTLTSDNPNVTFTGTLSSEGDTVEANGVTSGDQIQVTWNGDVVGTYTHPEF